MSTYFKKKKPSIVFAPLLAIIRKKKKKKHDFCGFLSSAFKGMDYLIAKNVLFDCPYSFILDYSLPFYNEFALYWHKDLASTSQAWTFS